MTAAHPECKSMSDAIATACSTPRYRPLGFGVTRAVLTEGRDGVRYLRAEQALAPSAPSMAERLAHWAAAMPERTFMAQRVKTSGGGKGEWKHISYAQALAAARNIGQALLDRGLNAERPVVIL